mmetsp:Transcript_21645/g.42512  ORF Transcript_21645/g.42512 Transcript_21645/m.42512 type:complete len:598 (-) Transcript_21645:507-2300(-)
MQQRLARGPSASPRSLPWWTTSSAWLRRRVREGSRNPEKFLKMSRKVLLYGMCAFVVIMIWRGWMLSESIAEALIAQELPDEVDTDIHAKHIGDVFGDASILDVDDDLNSANMKNIGRSEDSRDGTQDDEDTRDDGQTYEEINSNSRQTNPDEQMEEELPAHQKLSVLVTKDSISHLEEREEIAKEMLKDQNQFVSMWSSRKQIIKPVKDVAIEKHYMRGSWFEPGRKYFVYQPSGGMSNQRIILEQALLVARALGRVLVVPPLCPHTSMFWNYNKVDWDRTAEAFQIFDEVRMNNAVSTLGLSNIILRRFVEGNEPRSFPRWHRVELPYKAADRAPPYTTEDIQRIYGNDPAEVLFFAKYSMWKRFAFTEEELVYARQHVQLSAAFRRVSRIAVEHMFGFEPFIAVHIRFQDRDTMLLTDKLGPASSFVKRLTRRNATTVSHQMYVATQPSRSGSPYFESFRKAGFELTFSNKLAEVPEVGRFLARFPQNDIQSSLLGLIEQLICTRSSYFLGTGFSTFSRYIRIKRNSPALYYDLSLVPMRYQEDLDFVSKCTDADITEALRSTKPPVSPAVKHELELTLRESKCSEETTWLLPC